MILIILGFNNERGVRMKYKIIVAHPERQHSFKLASALKQNDCLFKYVTTVYDKESSFLMKCTKLFLSKENLHRAEGRKNPDLKDNDVIQFCELRGLIQIALYRFDKSKIIYNWWHKKTSKKFGKKVARLAIKENVDAVILYDANALTCFKILEERAPKILRIMDTSAANRLYMKTIYEKDMKICPQFSEKLKEERNFLWRSNYCKLMSSELNATQYFLAPSTFVKESLIYSGIKEEQIKICPYGSNFNINEAGERIKKDNSAILKGIYVGNVTEMKGIYYLLEAALKIPNDKFKLTVVGAFNNSDGIFDKYRDRINFVGRVTHEKVEEFLLKSDIFIFPSLGEGMSLAVLEAMACGLPCIVTKNSGVSDAINEGKNGYEIDVQNIMAIKEKIEWFIKNKDAIVTMGNHAIESAKIYTWENYNYNLIKIIDSILES